MSLPAPLAARVDAAPEAALASFVAEVRAAIESGAFESLVLSKPRSARADARAVRIRLIVLKGAPALSFVASHATRDLTRNLAVEAGLAELAALLDPAQPSAFAHATLHAAGADTQLLVSKKGRATVRRHVQGAGADVGERAAERARPRSAAPAPSAARPAVPGRARPHRRRPSRRAGDGPQVAPDRQVPRSARSRARCASRRPRREHCAASSRRLRLRQGLSDVRGARAPAPPFRHRAAGHRRRAARRSGRVLQRRRRAKRLRGLVVRRRRPAQRRAGGDGRDDRLARLRRRHRSRHRPRRARRRRGPDLLAVLPQGAAPAAGAAGEPVGVASPRHPSRPGGRDGHRQHARAVARDLRLRGAGVRIRLARAHEQEQDDPGPPRRGCAGTRGACARRSSLR